MSEWPKILARVLVITAGMVIGEYIERKLKIKKMSRFIDSPAFPIGAKAAYIQHCAQEAVKQMQVNGCVRNTCTGTETLSLVEAACAFGCTLLLNEDDYDGWDWENTLAFGGSRPSGIPRIL